MRRAFGLRLVQIVLVGLCTAVAALGLTALPAGALPDGRVYELVSPTPPGQDANIYIPAPGNNNFSVEGEHGIWTKRPFQVASDGEAVIYPGDPPVTGGTGNAGQGGGNEYLATRSPGGGWTQLDLQPSGIYGADYLAFSNDLSVGILTGPANESIPGADAPLNYSNIDSHSTSGGAGGEYHPIFTAIPPYRSVTEFDGVNSDGGQPKELAQLYAGANSGTNDVPGYSHLLFEANDALLEGEGQLAKEVKEGVEKEVEEGKDKASYLYDSVGGREYLVDVLPDGKVEPYATFGSLPEQGENSLGLTHVISADGSRIFWTATPEAFDNGGLIEDRSKGLYVRENDTQPQSPVGTKDECTVSSDACTVQVDEAVGGGGIFQTASTDGSKVFFTKHDLYEYDVNNGQTMDLTPGVEVLGVAGTSENAEYVYYIDASYQLELWHDGVTTHIATLSDGDGSAVSPFGAGGGEGYNGDWQTELGRRTVEVTPAGHSLIFMSNEKLKTVEFPNGYDNEYHGPSGDEGEEITGSLDEVYLYEAESGKLRCVSCNPSGEPPVPTEASLYTGHYSGQGAGAFFPISESATYQPQSIAEDGGRVFFSSGEPLVPQATNGWLNVYEWEREGTGSCREERGCVYMLSNGTDPENAYLLGSSANGDDAFLITRAQLSAQDRGDDDVVYDARVGGMQPPVAAACSGTGCQGVPPAPPIFATPSSVTFEGVGNFVPAQAAAPVAKSKSKGKPVKCKKGYVKQKGKCVKKAKRGKAKKSAKGRK